MKRLRAIRRVTYPADAKSLAIVLEAGGKSKLTEEQRRRVKWKDVAAGKFCDDLPEISRESLLAKGAVEYVDVDVDAEPVHGIRSFRRTRKDGD